MKIRHIISIFLCCWLQTGLASSLVEHVDTRVGTAASVTEASGLFGKGTEELGQTIPAVLTPNGMNFWTPQTRDTEQKCIAPYYYADSTLQGFRNSHWIVGGCTQDYGSMTIMPLMGELRCAPSTRASRFSHEQEEARPYRYAVSLPDEKLQAEMTATSRAAIFRFKYADSGDAYLVVNPNSDEGEGFIAVDTARNIIYGYNPVHRIYQGWGEQAGFAGHFVIEFKDKIGDYGCFVGDVAMPGVASIGKKQGIGCYVKIPISAGDEIIVKIGSSFTGHEGALANLAAEIPNWDFDEVADRLQEKWDKHLGAIEVESDDADALSKFYGAMYRASFLPHEVNDVDGSYCTFASGYPVRKLNVGETGYYDDFSMWDTYRALHPLINILHPAMGGEMMQSLVHKYEQGGWMPIFPCWNSYTAAMIGDHCTAAIADAYVKGIRNFDIEKAYEGMRKNAFETPQIEEYLDGKGRRALTSYLACGYIPLEDTVPNAFHQKEQVSRTLEYAYDDFALAQVAKLLGKADDYNVLAARSKNYIEVINPATGYADGKDVQGNFCGDDAFRFTKHITEGAPCHYTWYVPHDPYGLMELMGGAEPYVAKLDSMFSERRYWHGNEPCHQVAYMYNYAGEPWKTAREVRKIMDTEYLNCPGGLSGNDDAGQMSAWYVFAALGFYPVCPASPYYIISSPSFKSVTINLENGNQVRLLAPNGSKENIYIREVRRNGAPYNKNYLTHDDLLQGGTWEFDMSPTPTEWGTKAEDCPPSLY